MRTLLLNPPSFVRYDSAGARFQATRITHSMWYPAWLAHAAALIEESRLLDCPAEGMGLMELLDIVGDYDVMVFYTSTPSLINDLRVAESIKKANSGAKVIFAGPHPSVLPEETLKLSLAVDAVARREFDFTVLEVSEGRLFSEIAGLSWRKNGKVIHNQDRELLTNLDELPFVSKIYKRDLPVGAYYLPFTLRPYISIYAGRGCPYNCTFCLWPQTFTGRRYRKRSVQNVIEEVEFIRGEMPEIKEIFFDDDTFTVDRNWLREFCEAIKPLGITWSVNARADVPLDVLTKMKAAGCRLLVVGYESADQGILDNVKKGLTVEQYLEFTRNCREVGLMIHGTFVLGLPGETKDTIEKTLRFACEQNFDTIQISIATPLPGTDFFEYCKKNGYLKGNALVSSEGYQQCVVSYPHLSDKEILREMERFHMRYCFRGAYILKLGKLCLGNLDEARRIFTSGREYLRHVVRTQWSWLRGRSDHSAGGQESLVEPDSETVYSKEEQEQIEERLRRIGYL